MAKEDHGVSRVRIGETDRSRPGVELPLDDSVSAWIDNGTGERRAHHIDILIRAGINRRRARGPWPFVRPGRLDHFKIADVDCGKIVERD
ncbi:MAG: hypothetical protein DMF25_08725 [Verrucomicrobia bacterium]|nr:MAG: hypothetical protein DMF25_08725 [Verrucomicrobiota bacterium]